MGNRDAEEAAEMTKEEYLKARMGADSVAAREMGAWVRWAREDEREGRISGSQRKEQEAYQLDRYRALRAANITL